jgi:hypothetical protein
VRQSLSPFSQLSFSLFQSHTITHTHSLSLPFSLPRPHNGVVGVEGYVREPARPQGFLHDAPLAPRPQRRCSALTPQLPQPQQRLWGDA